MKTPQKLLLAFAFSILVAGAASAQIASDNAGNYAGGDWNTGSNGGSGFGAWAISSGTGTGGFAGAFVGNATVGGITGLANPSFGLFANPNSSGAFVNADRSFSTPLQIGQTFSVQWGINYDSGTDGNKGFNLYTGAPGTGEIVNINNAGNPTITINGQDTGFGYGTNAMTWSFTYASETQLSVTANDRDGTGLYSGNITIGAAPNSFRFYASQMQAGDQAQPYFNNLSVVPEPSTYALIALGAAFVLWRVRRRVASGA